MGAHANWFQSASGGRQASWLATGLVLQSDKLRLHSDGIGGANGKWRAQSVNRTETSNANIAPIPLEEAAKCVLEAVLEILALSFRALPCAKTH